jgi:catechol 2,3-dioxygenase-like lactoylglutathione lyase family enzyme
MAVRRIVAVIAAERVGDAQALYAGILGLSVAMDLGWIVTFAGTGVGASQISIAAQGGSGTPVPDISVEVDDIEDVRGRAIAAGISIECGPADAPWGVRRFYIRDPFGRLVDVLAHAA